MGISLVLWVVLLSAVNAMYSQSMGVSYQNVFDVNRVYDKASGKHINADKVQRIIRDNPNIVFEQVIDKYGNIESRLLDTLKLSRKGNRDISKRVQKGEPFPPFVMKSLSNRILDSEKLKGGIILIQFQLMFREPFLKIKTIEEFEELVSEFRKTMNLEAIILTDSSKSEILENIDTSKYISEFVPDGRNFNEKYLVVSFPSIVLIDTNGNLVSYYDPDEIDKLKLDIGKLN
tara:strand:+ start:9361 stop:10056 length:696 start_codon:yes stop_codon:yes gene_type:complete